MSKKKLKEFFNKKIKEFKKYNFYKEIKDFFKRYLIFFIIVEILFVLCIWQYDLLLIVYKAFIDAFKREVIASKKIIVTTIEIATFIFAIIALCLFYKRVTNQKKQTAEQIKQTKNQDKQVAEQIKQTKIQEKQINLQIEQRVDERFNDAIKLLASNESSARTGGIYVLYHLFIDDKKSKYREQIGKVLCSHIRSKTQEVKYQKLHKKRPSNEIQTCINLLFKKGNLYDKYRADLDNADLSHAYLVGADFSSAECQNTIFYFAKCQGACFRFANCQVANFVEANCQGVNFYNTKMQGVKFYNTQMQGTYALKDKNYLLEERIGKDTQLKDIIFTGALDRKDIKAIKKVKYLYRETYQRLQNANKANKGKKPSNKIPKDIAKNMIAGKLENSKEIEKIIAE